jgi:AmiR/NasT family two-component response regulator
MMSAIRVLVANQPRLMRELVLATISDQPDIEIVGQIHDDAEIEQAVSETHPDFVIVALDDSDRLSHSCRILLERNPHLRVIAIAPNRESTMCYWASLNIESNRIESSEESVLSALRGKVQLAEG